MKANSKRIMNTVMALVVAVQMFSVPQSVFASQVEDIINTCTNVDSEHAEMIYDIVSESIVNKYAGIYEFDDFQFMISNQRIHDGIISVDVDVTANMTLIKNPKDSQYVKGMENAIGNLTEPDEILAATSRMEEYLKQVMPCYNETIPIGYEYQVDFPNQTMTRRSVQDEIVVYHKVETDSVDLLSEINLNDRFDESENYTAGKNDIMQSIEDSQESMYSVRSVSYSRSQAAEYAFTHAMDEPEYSGNGNSDCANFVSKCINAGGIPEDRTGNWYQGSTNWIRTGYYNNGGVVPYMVNKGYFAAVSSSSKATLGSIMSWNTKSHVAIVSRIDGYSIYYSHHSDTAKTSRYYQYTSSTDNVTFYVPQI